MRIQTHVQQPVQNKRVVCTIYSVASTVMNIRGRATQIGALIRQACEEGARPQGIVPTDTPTWI